MLDGSLDQRRSVPLLVQVAWCWMLWQDIGGSGGRSSSRGLAARGTRLAIFLDFGAQKLNQPTYPQVFFFLDAINKVVCEQAICKHRE